jgi:ADP-heptose:LPS heptosyltransferase
MKVLVIRLSSLGDVILCTSVLPFLKREGFRVDFLTFKPFGEVLKGQPFVDRVIEVERGKLRSFSSIRELSETLKGYDFAFDLHDVLRTKILRKFLPFKTYVYDKKAFLRRLMVIFKPFKSKWLYVPELYAGALKKAGIEVKNPRPVLFPDENLIEKFKRLIPENPVAVSPTARWEGKRYPLEKFVEVVRILKSEGFNPLIVGGKEGEEVGKVFEKAGALNFCGKLSLKESLSLISLCKAVVSNDTAVTHMARALKVPVVSIFGPTHPAFGFAPFKDEGIALTLNLSCSPCSLHGKVRCKERKCFNIPPEKVAEAVLSLIGRESEA